MVTEIQEHEPAMARALGMLFAEETSDGTVRVHAEPTRHAPAHMSRDTLQYDVRSPQSLLHCLMHTLGLQEDETEVARFLRLSRIAPQTWHTKNGSVIFCRPTANGGLSAWANPPRHTNPPPSSTAEWSAGIAHEIANSLTALGGWLQMAQLTGPLPLRTKRALATMERSLTHALGKTRLLQRASKPKRTPLPKSSKQATLNAIVREVLEAESPLCERAGIKLQSHLTPDLTVSGRRADLHTVVSNLIVNAREAMQEQGGGTLQVSTIATRDSKKAYLCVEDSGPGMSPETLKAAFKRHFTTKSTGTGLGLALVQTSANMLGATLHADSHTGRGTRMRVFFPQEMKAFEVKQSGVLMRPKLAGLDVLVVEDDADLRTMIETALRLQGANVTCAEGVQATKALEGQWHAALVDLGLGDGRGDELLAQLKQTQRIERSILMTGSANPILQGKPAPDHWMRKPFDLDELTTLLSAHLRSSELPRSADG